MSNFKRGDRVAFHFDKSTVGTVTRANKSETRVLWADGIETPVDPLELIHAEKDRSISDQESAAAPTESPSKETIIIQSTDLKPAAQRPQFPAGFRAVAILSLDEPHRVEEYEIRGPEATSRNITVQSFWSEPGGVEFHVTNSRHADNGIFTREELDVLPGLIVQVTQSLDIAHAVEYMRANPVPARRGQVPTATDIAIWCVAHDIGAVAGNAAFEQLHPESRESIEAQQARRAIAAKHQEEQREARLAARRPKRGGK